MSLAIDCQDSDDAVLTQEEEAAQLALQLDEIKNLAQSVPCENAEEWTFTAYGSKACGGPAGYIAYSLAIDNELFLEMVDAYTQAERNYNEKWGVVSDCSMVVEPTSVTCQNGEPVFEYQSIAN